MSMMKENIIFVLKWLVIFAAKSSGKKQEVCLTEEFVGRCPSDSAIIMESAFYGQMRLGSCLEVDVGYLGCQNDVLLLADAWCSGRQTCQVPVPNEELNSANRACNVRGLPLFLEIEYNCVTVVTPDTKKCSLPTPVNIYANEGYISSYVTLQTDCGLERAPWILQVASGQRLELWLLDFGALRRHNNALYVTCQQILGHIIERDIGSNITICADNERKKHLYISKTNALELVFSSDVLRTGTAGFMIQYSIVGCSDLTPPAHAWYKRDGNEAVIGCKANDRLWRLYCNGNTWDGVVGNCSAGRGTKDGIDAMTVLPFSSIIFLTCVICGAILLIIIVVVAGAVYVKKQSIRHQIKLRSEYACATLSSTQYFIANPPGYDVTLARTTEDKQQIEDNQPLVQVSDRTLPTRHDTTLVPLTDRPNINSS